MATIQVRDIPDDVHAELQRQAREAGQSLQAFMRQWVVERTRADARRAAVLAEMQEIMRADGGRGFTTQEILDTRDAERR